MKSLNDIEKTVIEEFLKTKNIEIEDKVGFFEDVKIKDKEMSPVGFHTFLEKSEKLRVSDLDKTYKWGSLGITINRAVETGYLIYVEQGYIDCIEGYTYEEDWPVKISSIKPYCIE